MVSFSTQQDRGRDLDAERLCCRQVDDEFELGRLLDRQVAWIFAAKHPVGIGSQTHIGKALVGSIAQQTPRLAIFTPAEHRRQLARDGELREALAVDHRHAFRKHQQRIGGHAAEPGQRVVEFAGACERKIGRFDAERLRALLRHLPFRSLAWMKRIREHRQFADVWKDLLQQVHALGREIAGKKGTAGKIAFRPREALDDAELDGITADRKQHGDVGHPAHGLNGRTAGYREIDLLRRDLLNHAAQRLRIARRVAQLDGVVTIFGVAEAFQPFAKPIHERVRLRLRRDPEDATKFLLLLRGRGQGPKR